MKKASSVILALMLFLGMCACSNKAEEPTEPVETVTIEKLLEDTENGARAQLNVGKATTIYGQVDRVHSTCCEVYLFVAYNDSYTNYVKVEMPTEQLAELQKDQFVVIRGTVSNCDSNGYYTISGHEMLDLILLDSYIEEKVHSILDYSNDALVRRTQFVDTLNPALVYDYVRSRGDIFTLRDNTALKEYLIGTWVESKKYETCEFKEDGTYLWKYIGKTGLGKPVNKEQIGTWSVSDGHSEFYCKSSNGIDTTVYVLSEDIFLIMSNVYVKE